MSLLLLMWWLPFNACKIPASAEAKKLLVEDAFRRIGKLSPRINDVIGMENPFRYRNKTALPVGGDYKKPQIGFYRKMTHDIVDIDYCLIQHEFCDDVIKGMKDLIQKHKIEVYDEKSIKVF